MNIKRLGIAVFVLLFALSTARSSFAFSSNYHEVLALCCWRAHFPDTPPTMENGGIYFILAASGADIRGGAQGVKPLRSYPDVWSRINWRHFHTRKGAPEFLKKIGPKGLVGWTLADVMKKTTPEALEKDFEPGRALAAVALNERQMWIARGWALHNLCDHLGVLYRFREKPGGNGKMLPENALIESPNRTDSTKFLDNYNDTLSAFWAGLGDVDPELRRGIDETVSDPKRGGKLLANFAFVLQRGYDSCGADDLGMASGLERAQKVMLPTVNEFAYGVRVPGLGRHFVFGWGITKNYTARETYARDVVLPELYKKIETKKEVAPISSVRTRR
ncbi:MAG: hypothetical protein GXP25_05875 [Planctomycetes bacterium]|nr:hypothetical protein [Planctomycetota bacterium]